MEIVCKVFFGVLILVWICLTAGLIDAWWEQRKREKEREKRKLW